VPVSVTGTAWQDHQWGNFAGTGGWTWFSLQLSNGTQYMLFFLHNAAGAIAAEVGTLINADGSTVNIDPCAMNQTPLGTWTSPNAGITYPQNWTVTVPGGQLTVTALEAVIEGSPFHGALIARLAQHCQDAAVHPVLVTVDSLPQLLDHITDKEQQRAPGAEPRGWRANASVLMTIQDFLVSDAARHAVPRMRAAQPILDGGSL
jgi:hypothetical protein